MSNLRLSRRQTLKLAAGPMLAAAGVEGAVMRTSLGVSAASYASRARASGGFRNAETFVGHCREIGAGGIQVPLSWLEATSPGRVRKASRGLDEMWVEMAVDLPRDQADLGDFQSQLRQARNCGAEIVRTSLLNLLGMVRRIRQARPNVRFTLDLARREPLEVPFLREHYWVSLPKLPGWRVAGTMAWVRENRREGDLPKLRGGTLDERLNSEHDDVRRSLAYAVETLGL